MAKNKVSQSEIDGVQYRRAKMWQIFLYACNGLVGMSVYTLINMASYSASVGYGITTAVIGVILTCTRILDGVTDPMLAFLYDRVNTRFGKIRILMVTGFVIESIALWLMYSGMSSKGFGVPVFVILYIVYVIGYTITNMTAQTIPNIMTNDPKQRPTLSVWTTAFNYLVPMVLSIVFSAVLLPMFGGEYNQEFLTAACLLCIAVGAVGTVLVCIGVSEYDRPENFRGVSAKKEKLSMKDMAGVLKDNRALQTYIASAASDKLAQQVGSQSVITTLIYGILIGNMTMATIISAIAMFPSMVFAIFGARYVGRHGSKLGIINWTKVSLVISVITFVFFVVVDTTKIASFGPEMIIYMLLTFAQNGSNMCVTTANSSYMSDTIDYELDRSGRYIPAVVTGSYSLVDKLVTAFSAVIATGAVALIGYTSTLPQPGDALTAGVFWVAMAVKFGLPILGWIVTLFAMRYSPISKEGMIDVQKRIEGKKAEIAQQGQ